MNLGTFNKMHGLGNDFIIVDERIMQVPIDRKKIAAYSNRYTGIGCDQFIILMDSHIADVKMEIYNNDGSKVGACGNASRCVIALLGQDASIETEGGLISGQKLDTQVEMNMGTPRFEWQDIPLAYAMDSGNLPVEWEKLNSGFCVNVGNPHIIFFVDDMESIDIKTIGSIIENDAIFPEKINVNIASINNGEIDLKVWERGAGLTQACGTGACATAVAAISKKLVSSPVQVNLPGGMLTITWSGDNILMRGDTVNVFKGEIDWDAF